MKKHDETKEGETPPDNSKTYGYISFVISIAALLCFCLIPLISIYGLCCDILLAFASLGFYNTQKKRGLYPLAKAAKVIAYIALIIGMVVFLGGVIYAIAAA